MRVIDGEDVNELYWRGMNMLRTDGHVEESRVGMAMVMPEPVTSIYRKPLQRVLLDCKRGANPFFHLFEALWMLAGRDDVEVLNRYITDFGTRFAEPNGRIHGAYGYRWRKAFGFDQLDIIVGRLRANHRDRQCVLQMWDSENQNDLRGDWKDRPCNTHVYFRIRESQSSFAGEHVGHPVLDMMVSCRSNDIIFGAYGANAVHFSILQEYMAGRIGVQVGVLEQISFNYHAYVDVYEKIGCPIHLETYSGHKLKPQPMASNWQEFDVDLARFMLWHRGLLERGEEATKHDYKNLWFRYTAEPMFIAHYKFKNAMQREADKYASLIQALDWRHAVHTWFKIRQNARSR